MASNPSNLTSIIDHAKNKLLLNSGCVSPTVEMTGNIDNSLGNSDNIITQYDSNDNPLKDINEQLVIANNTISLLSEDKDNITSILNSTHYALIITGNDSINAST